MSVWNSYFSVLCPSFSKMVVKFTMFFTFSSSSLVILGPASFPTRVLLSLQTIDVQLALILLRTLITMLVTSTPPAPPHFSRAMEPSYVLSNIPLFTLFARHPFAGCFCLSFLHRPPTLTSFTHTFSLLLPSNFSRLFARLLMPTLFNLFSSFKRPHYLILWTPHIPSLFSQELYDLIPHIYSSFSDFLHPNICNLQFCPILWSFLVTYLPLHRFHLEKSSYSASAPPDESTSHYRFMHANCRPPLHQSATFLLRWW